eukprot:766464-Hanusia_phi.AAC.7
MYHRGGSDVQVTYFGPAQTTGFKFGTPLYFSGHQVTSRPGWSRTGSVRLHSQGLEFSMHQVAMRAMLRRAADDLLASGLLRCQK